MFCFFLFYIPIHQYFAFNASLPFLYLSLYLYLSLSHHSSQIQILCSFDIPSKFWILSSSIMASTDSSNWTLISNPPLQKPKSLLLKDYLLDDFSSCSSNGFRSFPRRQCCSTTVRFLLEIDLKVKDSSFTKKFLPRTSSRKIALSTISTLQRASDAVLRAFKQFPLPSSRKSFFPRSISRKLISKAFRKKSDIVDPNNRRWKSFKEFLDEKEPPSSSSFEQNHSDSAVCTAIAVAGRNSISSCSNSISWTESEFTSEIIPSSCSGNSESCSENGAVKDDKDSPVNLIGKRDGVTFGKDSMEETGTPSAVAAAAGEYREDTVKVSIIVF